MYRSVVPAVVQKYGLEYRTIYPVQKGYRNESYPVELLNGQMVNLLFYKRESDIVERVRRGDHVSEYIAQEDLPVRTRFDKRLLRLVGVRGEVYAGLYCYLPGRTISWEAYTKKHIKLLGWAMSDIHHRLSSMPVGGISEHTIAAELDQLILRMKRYWGDDAIRRAMHQKLGVAIDLTQLNEMRTLVALCGRLPNQHMLHMDMVRGNVLFGIAGKEDRWQIDTVALTGVIDFEKAAYGHPIFDIARTIAFLMVDCANKPPDKVYTYFLYSGYMKRGAAPFTLGKLAADNHTHTQLLHGLIRLFLVHDFYKFLRHTPYESLADNHHYVRTRDILLHYAMLRYL